MPLVVFPLAFACPVILLLLATRRVLPVRERRSLARQWWFLAAILVALLADRWFLGFPSKDVLFIQQEHAHELMLGGGDWFWSTATGLGKPVLAHPLSTVLHPFAWTYLWPSPKVGVHLFVAVHLLWGAAWWWLLLARTPQTRGGRRGGWWIRSGVVLAMLNGFVIARLGGQQGMEYALAAQWVPTALYALVELVRGRRHWLAPACLLALSAAATATSCPNLALVAAPVLIGFTVLVAWTRQRGDRSAFDVLKRPGPWVAAGLALLMAAPEILPAAELLAANDGFTYARDATGYRFRPFTAGELAFSFSGLGETSFGRDVVWGILPLGLVVTCIVAARRHRRLAMAAATAMLLGAADWAAGGLGYQAAKAVVPAIGSVSVAPTVQALFAWGVLGVFVAAPVPRRLPPVAGAAFVGALALSLLFATRIHRGQPGFDADREAKLFAWTADLDRDGGQPFVADLQPVTDRAYLIPDPVARAQGIRTLGEDWYAVLPRTFYEKTLPDRRGDWRRLHRMGITHVVALSAVNQAPDLYRHVALYQAFEMAAHPLATRSFFAQAVQWLAHDDPGWNGLVHVFEAVGPPTGPPDPEDLTNRTDEGPHQLWWLWLLVAALCAPPLLRRRR